MTPNSANAHTTTLSAFTDSVPDDHAPEVLSAHSNRIDAPLLPEQDPDLISSVIMDNAPFTALPSLISGFSATPRFNFCALLETGSTQSFIHEGDFGQIVATGATDAFYVRSTTPRSWSGFGSRQLLSTHRQARMTIQFCHDGTPSASLAVWVYIVPNEIMRCSFLLGRDSWMRFNLRYYQTLPPQSDGRVFGEHTLSYICDDDQSSAAANIRNNCKISGVAYHLVYDGRGVSLEYTSQLAPVNLVRLDEFPTLTGHYMTDMIPVYDDSNPSVRFASPDRQSILLTGDQELKPRDVLGTASSPLLRWRP